MSRPASGSSHPPTACLHQGPRDANHTLLGGSRQTPCTIEVRIQGLSALVDNIILLEYMDVGAELKRLLSVIKQRGSGHDGNVRELVITDRGIELASDGTTAQAILSGLLRAGRETRRPRET